MDSVHKRLDFDISLGFAIGVVLFEQCSDRVFATLLHMSHVRILGTWRQVVDI